jgi:amino acid transporter
MGGSRGNGGCMSATESIDVRTAEGVDTLKPNAVGLGGVLFACLAGAAPILAMLGNVPFAVGSGNGIATPGGFLFATIVLSIFSVGYVAMARKITAVGGFYSFISHGLGRVMGVSAGLVGAVAYCTIEAGVIAAIGYFSHDTFSSLVDTDIPWPVFSFIALVAIMVLNYFDVDLSLKVLGVFMILEVIVLVVVDIAILLKGGGHSWTAAVGESGTTQVASDLNASSLNPFKAFSKNGIDGIGPAIGIFMAFWSWVGFEAAPNYAEESRDPVRNVPRATYIAVLALGAFYVFTSWMFVSAWGGNAELGGDNGAQMFYLPTAEYAGEFVQKSMKWLIITGSFACAMAFHNAATRYWYSLGREGLLPKPLGKTHPTHKSPYVASTAQTVVAGVLVAIFAIFGAVEGGTRADWALNGAFAGAYTQLAILATLLILILQTLVSIAIPVYFRRFHPADANPITTLVCPAIATVAQMAVIWLLLDNLSNLGGTKGFVPFIPWVGFGIAVLGVAVALAVRSSNPALYNRLGRMVVTGDDDHVQSLSEVRS